jgi:hypothetical protein
MTYSSDSGPDGTALIAGIVHASGPGGAQLDEEWMLQFSLEAWRDAGGSVRRSELKVRRRVSDAELRRLMDRLDAYQVVSLRVRLSEGDAVADLVELLGTNESDAELKELSREFQQPIVLQDDTFGQLVLDKRVDWYSGKATWSSQSIGLNVTRDDEDSASASLEVAKTLWQDQAGWGQRVSEFAVKALLPLKNESWLEDDEQALTPEQFRARMKLESVTVFSDGSFEFWHDDGDLFFGHAIRISGNLAEGLNDADIPG